MKKYILFSIMLMLGINVFGQSIKFYTNEESIETGSEGTITVRMATDVGIEGFQFDINLPDGISLSEEKKPIRISDWSESHTISYQQQEDGSIRVLVVSIDGDVLNAGENDIIYIDLVAQNGLNPGDYAFSLTGTIVSAEGFENKIKLEDYTSTLSVVEKQTNVGFQINKVEVSPGANTTLIVNLDSNIELSGFQFDLEVPDGITVMTKDNTTEKSERPKMTERAIDHTISTNLLENGKTRFIVVSLEDESINAGNGPIMEITIKADESAKIGNYNPHISGIVVSSPLFENKITLEDTVYDFCIIKPTAIEGIGAATENENAPMYNLAGQRVSRVQKGIFIQNGKKVLK